MQRPRESHQSGHRFEWLLGIVTLAAVAVAVFFIARGVAGGWGTRPAGDLDGPRSAGATSDPTPAPSPLQPLTESSAAAPESVHPKPHLPPGEPGVKDVQEWDWLQQDLEQFLALTDRDARGRLAPDPFRTEYIGATIEFLELDDEDARRFGSSVDLALADIASARQKMEAPPVAGEHADQHPHPLARSAARWDAFRGAQREAVRHVLDALDEKPRHRLLRDGGLKWLLRLDYGLRAAAR